MHVPNDSFTLLVELGNVLNILEHFYGGIIWSFVHIYIPCLTLEHSSGERSARDALVKSILCKLDILVSNRQHFAHTDFHGPHGSTLENAWPIVANYDMTNLLFCWESLCTLPVS